MTYTSDRLKEAQFIIPAITLECCATCTSIRLREKDTMCVHLAVRIKKTQIGGKCDYWIKLKGA
jgi:hypothetical protein